MLIKNALIGLLSGVVLIWAVTVATPINSQGQGNTSKDVTVVNTTAQPVPITALGTTNIAGQVSITNTPDVQIANVPTVLAQQSGSWNMGIAGPVEIGNGVSNPVPVRAVDNPISQVFQDTVSVSLPDGEQVGTTNAFQVPADKRAVIETITLSCHVFTVGQYVRPFLHTEVGGLQSSYRLALSQPLNSVTTPVEFSATLPVRLYADAGTMVDFTTSRGGAGGTAGSAQCICWMSGHFVDLP